MLDGESMLVGEATLDSDAIKTRPLPVRPATQTMGPPLHGLMTFEPHSIKEETSTCHAPQSLL